MKWNDSGQPKHPRNTNDDPHWLLAALMGIGMLALAIWGRM